MFALRIIDSDYSQFYALKSPRKQVAQRYVPAERQFSKQQLLLVNIDKYGT